MIDYGAFGYCSSLECIIIPSSVKKIKSFAFNGCDKLIKVVCFAKNPPVLDSYSFEALSSKILYVPNKSLSEYKSTNIWNGFGIIQSADEEINPGTLSSCSTPNLTFFSGNLSFESSTPGAEYHYTIKDSDVATDKYNIEGKVQLMVSWTFRSMQQLMAIRHRTRRRQPSIGSMPRAATIPITSIL